MNNDLIKDLSDITTIQEGSLIKLVDKSKFIICHDVLESTLKGEDETKIDVGIGTLVVKVEAGNIRYRFIPSPSLGNAIGSTVVNKKSPLTYMLETSLVSKIEHVHKELL